jgi:foldase protein PrsA
MPHSMRSPVRSIAALGAVFFATVGLAACSGGVPGDAVVQINGTPLTKATFNHWMTIAAAAGQSTPTGSKPVVPAPPAYTACIAHLRATQPKPAKGQVAPSEAQLKSQCEQQYTTYKNTTLGFLIQSSWIIGQAEEMKISASEKEVIKVFNRLKKQSFPSETEFKKFLARSAQTVSDLELRVKVQSVLVPKIEKQVAKEGKKPVTSAEATKYYNEHKSLYGQPERRNLLVVLTKTEAQANSAKKEIESGKSFASVAKAHSIDPISKAKGGSLPEVTKAQEQKELGEAVFSAKVNTLSGPVKTPFGYYVFEVQKVLPATTQPLSKVESGIKQQLGAQKQQKFLQKFISGFKKRWTARTECRKQYMTSFCKGYKAPKPPTTTPTTPTAPKPSTSSTATSSGKSK